MFRMHLIVPVAAGLALAAVAAPQALAFAPPTGQQSSEPPVGYTATQQKVNLSPITVRGHHIPMPVALQMYKKALTRTWSVHPADRNKLVCLWRAAAGTHMQTLYCQTNAQHEKLASATQLALINSEEEHPEKSTFKSVSGHRVKANVDAALFSGSIPYSVANATTKHALKRGSMETLMAQLPPTNTSYTVRVTGKKGKPILDYVFKNGDLVHVYQYVYKNGKPDKGKH